MKYYKYNIILMLKITYIQKRYQKLFSHFANSGLNIWGQTLHCTQGDLLPIPSNSVAI